MAGILEGRILESFLAPLKGSYTGSEVAENELVAQLAEEFQSSGIYQPCYSLWVRTIGGGRFCYASPMPAAAGESFHSLPLEKYKEMFGLYYHLKDAKTRGLPVVLVGVKTTLCPDGWHSLVYARTHDAEFDLRENLLERLAGNQAKPE